MKDPAPPKVGATYSEADWNETSTVEGGEAYWVSKTQAERGAWEAAARLGLDLVTILPGGWYRRVRKRTAWHAGYCRGTVESGSSR